MMLLRGRIGCQASLLDSSGSQNLSTWQGSLPKLPPDAAPHSADKMPLTTVSSALMQRRESMAAIKQSRPTEMPRAFKNERSVSCPVRGSTSERFVFTSSGITFESEAFRLQNEARIARLLETATSPVSSSTNAILAKKALKYRDQRSLRVVDAARLLYQ
ncbi:hypothetical protein V7S43_018619 [Phytophthora oleae]|uniref:Uncharacterized protein n=1 Tax=Phytophthora oleae TaxID=2107226 RepID=A0ABD3EU43_9STRA